jgi:hypothetical protein
MTWLQINGRLSARIIIGFLIGVHCATAGVTGMDSINLETAAPYNNLFSNENPRESFVNMRIRPYDRDDLAFTFLIHKSWRDIPVVVQPDALTHDSEVPVPLTEQRAPEAEPGFPLIEVRYLRLELEVSLKDWVDYYLSMMNYTPLLRQSGTFNERDVEDIIIRSVEDSVPYIARLTFSRHGNRMFLVIGSAAESIYGKYAKMFGLATVSFTVKDKSSNEFVEKMIRFRSQTDPELSFQHPESWDVKLSENAPKGKAAADIGLQLRDVTTEIQKLMSMIRVKQVAGKVGETPEQVLSNLKKDFSDSDLVFKRRICMADVNTSLAAPLGKLYTWDVTVSGSPAELSCLLVPKGTDTVALGLLVPKKEDNAYVWMSAWRVFEIVAGGVVLPEDPGLENLARQSLVDFAHAVNNRDFKLFHASLASDFQKQITPDQLFSTFRSFSDKKIDLTPIKDLKPQFDSDHYVGKDGQLVLEGSFPTDPTATQFKLTYIFERSEWRLFGIKVLVKE